MRNPIRQHLLRWKLRMLEAELKRVQSEVIQPHLNFLRGRIVAKIVSLELAIEAVEAKLKN